MKTYTITLTKEQLTVVSAGLSELKLGVAYPVYTNMLAQVQKQEKAFAEAASKRDETDKEKNEAANEQDASPGKGKKAA